MDYATYTGSSAYYSLAEAVRDAIRAGVSPKLFIQAASAEWESALNEARNDAHTTFKAALDGIQSK